MQLVATWYLQLSSNRFIDHGGALHAVAWLHYVQWILSAYKFTVSVFYVLQIIPIVVLLKYNVDPCPDKSRFDFWPSAISVTNPWFSSWPRKKIGVQNILECHPLDRVPCLWNAKPFYTNTMKKQLRTFLFNHFIANFDSVNNCTFHFLCLCAKSQSLPRPPWPNFNNLWSLNFNHVATNN